MKAGARRRCSAARLPPALVRSDRMSNCHLVAGRSLIDFWYEVIE